MPLVAAALLALVLNGAASPLPQTSSPGAPTVRLTAVQRRLVDAWPGGTQRYDSAPDTFHLAFEAITARLTTLVLSDPENGEILGAAIDLVEALEPLERQPATGSNDRHRLAVTLAPGARDRLRRAAEFEAAKGTGGDGGTGYVHAGPPLVRISMSVGDSRAVIALGAP